MYLVSNEHDDDVGLGMVAQLLEPPLHVLECDLLGDVVHQQRTHRTSVSRDERINNVCKKVSFTERDELFAVLSHGSAIGCISNK